MTSHGNVEVSWWHCGQPQQKSVFAKKEGFFSDLLKRLNECSCHVSCRGETRSVSSELPFCDLSELLMQCMQMLELSVLESCASGRDGLIDSWGICLQH